MFKKFILWIIKEYVSTINSILEKLNIDIINIKEDNTKNFSKIYSDIELIKSDISDNTIKTDSNILDLNEKVNEYNREILKEISELIKERNLNSSHIKQINKKLDELKHFNTKLIEDINNIKEQTQYISLPNEDIYKTNKIKNGTINYELINGNIVEKIYIDGTWHDVQSKIKEIENNIYSITLGEEIINKDIKFSKENGIVLQDISTEEFYKLYVDSNMLFLERV